MQHKYPFVVLHIDVEGENVDVNVHPTKMELRFSNQQEMYNAVYEAVDQALHHKELIPHVTLDVPKAHVPAEKPVAKPQTAEHPVSFASTQKPKAEVEKPQIPKPQERNLEYFMEQMKKRVHSYHAQFFCRSEK